VIAWITIEKLPVSSEPFAVETVSFDDLPGWRDGDPRGALDAFRRSCVDLLKRPDSQPMGWSGYAGTVAAWKPVCRALPATTASADAARNFFEGLFAPVAVSGTKPAHFTGYYEPELAVSWSRDSRFRVPVYGRPRDLVEADLGAFHAALAGQHIFGRLADNRLVPYATRAEIDRNGLPSAPVLLFADDPVSVFILQIQGSGRARFPDGGVMRLAYAAANGRPYTAIGRIILEKSRMPKKGFSLQKIRTWLGEHPAEANAVLEADQSFVFFALAPIGDPTLGSVGTEGVPLTGGASLASDVRLHPMGAPAYIATTAPDAQHPQNDVTFNRLLVMQDSGGAILGAARGDIYFGTGAAAEAVAGRMNAHGRFFVLVPKPVARALWPRKVFIDAPS
jgi:membrane-bound lytic murein transglycosylase A